MRAGTDTINDRLDELYADRATLRREFAVADDAAAALLARQVNAIENAIWDLEEDLAAECERDDRRDYWSAAI